MVGEHDLRCSGYARINAALTASTPSSHVRTVGDLGALPCLEQDCLALQTGLDTRLVEPAGVESFFAGLLPFQVGQLSEDQERKFIAFQVRFTLMSMGF